MNFGERIPESVPMHPPEYDEELSTCCGAPRWDDTDLCSECKEHAGFEAKHKTDPCIDRDDYMDR